MKGIGIKMKNIEKQSIIEPTKEEKMQYIKNVAKQNGLKINLEDWIYCKKFNDRIRKNTY